MRYLTRLGWFALAAGLIFVVVHYTLGLPRLPWKTLKSAPADVAQSAPVELSMQDLPQSSDLRETLEHLNGERFYQRERERARRYITRQLEDSGWVVMRQAFEIINEVEAGNDIVALVGSGVNLIAIQPDRSIAGSLVLGAHYDTVPSSPGADDNGTGVVAAIETAQILSAMSPPKALTLVFFDLEEIGLLGSRAFVDEYPDVSGAVILEMLGFRCRQPGCQRYPEGLPVTPPQTTGNFLAAIGDRGHQKLIDAFAEETSNALPVISLAVPTFGSLAPDLLRSDHVPFWRAGIGAVMLTDTAEFRNPHYHQPSDDIDTIDMEFFTSVTQRVIQGVHRLLWTF